MLTGLSFLPLPIGWSPNSLALFKALLSFGFRLPLQLSYIVFPPILTLIRLLLYFPAFAYAVCSAQNGLFISSLPVAVVLLSKVCLRWFLNDFFPDNHLLPCAEELVPSHILCTLYLDLLFVPVHSVECSHGSLYAFLQNDSCFWESGLS